VRLLWAINLRMLSPSSVGITPAPSHVSHRPDFGHPRCPSHSGQTISKSSRDSWRAESPLILLSTKGFSYGEG
jgi:hypothetical protein